MREKVSVAATLLAWYNFAPHISSSILGLEGLGQNLETQTKNSPHKYINKKPTFFILIKENRKKIYI
jgi:hypothetical protein